MEEIKKVKKFRISGIISNAHFGIEQIVWLMKTLGFGWIEVEEMNPKKNSKKRRRRN